MILLKPRVWGEVWGDQNHDLGGPWLDIEICPVGLRVVTTLVGVWGELWGDQNHDLGGPWLDIEICPVGLGVVTMLVGVLSLG